MKLSTYLHRKFIELYTTRKERDYSIPLCRQLEVSQYDDPETIRRRQWVMLKALTAHAYATVTHYAEQFRSLGLHPSDLRSFDDYRRLPVLTKKVVRTRPEALRSDAYRPGEVIGKSTSGSTGIPIRVVVNRASVQWKAACTLRSDQWSGWRLGEPVAKVWGNPEYRKRGLRGRLRNWLLDRSTYLDTLNITDAALATFTAQVARRKPTLLFGHAHSVFIYARYLKNRGLTPHRPKGIITSAMVLHTWQRALIEEVFGCKVTNRYGCEETSIIACECERHDGLHINADNIYLEVLPPANGAGGAILVTDLTNFAMPLLRYQLGDLCTLSDRACACGRGLPLIEKLQGRESDYVVTPAGRQISGVSLTENFVLKVPRVEQVQIVQHKLDRFTFRIVREDRFDAASHQQLDRLVHELFGGGVKYRVEFVDRLPQEASGKFKFCVSELAGCSTPEGALP